MGEAKQEQAVKPTVNVRFLYRHCNEIPPMRAFYTDGIGVHEKGCDDTPEYGWIVYTCDGLEFIVIRTEEPVPVLEGFATQPGDGGGPVLRSSISIELPPEQFAAAYERLAATDAPRMTDAPTWRQNSYWGWTVNDPVGETIELYTHPAERPEGDPPVWPG